MMSKPFASLATAVVLSLIAVMPFDRALAWSSPGPMPMASGPHCKTGSSIIINKSVNIFKPVTINNDVNINKSISIQKNINLSKNITIEKNITINKGNASAEAIATAVAIASASARANVGIIYFGSYYEENVSYPAGGEIGNVAASETCEMQEATVVKSIHALCVAPDGQEFPASHMLAQTFIDSSYEGEIARCIAGAHLKLVIGDVVQSDQGMAGTYEHGATLICGEHEAVRHYKNGMLKCETAVPVKDCTERTNLRKFGTGDMFFSYRAKICATRSHTAERNVELGGLPLEGGVGYGH